MNPGTTVIPPASMTCVCDPAMLRMSADEPTAMNHPCFTAAASARGSASSHVNTFAFTTTKSARPLPAAGGACASIRGMTSAPRTAESPAHFKNSPRVSFGIGIVPSSVRDLLFPTLHGLFSKLAGFCQDYAPHIVKCLDSRRQQLIHGAIRLAHRLVRIGRRRRVRV